MPYSIDFINTPWWKRVGLFLMQLIFFTALTAVLTIGIYLVLELIPLFSKQSSCLAGSETLSQKLFHDWLSVLLASFIAIFLLDYWQQKKGIAAYGFSIENIGKSILTGLVVASSILFISFFILLGGGWAHIVDYSLQWGVFLAWGLFFIIQPLAEEIIMRSFLQTQLHRHFGTHIGLFMTALTFTLLHSGNDNITLLARIQIFAGGYLMGLLYLQTKNIWASFAMHASWNFLQSTVLGFAVSGIQTYSVFRTETNGADWLTGGDFGLEGSLLTLVLILFAIAYFWKATKNATPFGEEKIANGDIAINQNHPIP